MASSNSICLHGSVRIKPYIVPTINVHLKTSLSSISSKPFFREIQQIPLRIAADVSKGIKNASQRLLDAFVDSTFRFVDQPLISSQSNFAPVEEIGEEVRINSDSIQGQMPADFPEGVYIRNGSNPQFGAFQSTQSIFGNSSDIWVEGEGMIHAVYFSKDSNNGDWIISYKNKYVESETFKLEKGRKKPCFLPSAEGDSAAVLAGQILNQLRFGKVNKYVSNTNVFEHAGRIYTTAESHIPQEINVLNLETYSNWDLYGAWNRPFTSHPKKAPGSEELVIIGADARKPYLVLGIISADGRKFKHKVDLKFNRSIICHELGVTNLYNIIMDMPLIVDMDRLIKGGPLIKYEKESYARIGVMPRYGIAESVKWFTVEPGCVFHIFNCFEIGEEVVIRGCRAPDSIIPGPDYGRDKMQWFSRGFKPNMGREESPDDHSDGLFFSRVYEWRLNMCTENASERYLTGSDFSVDFPMINDHFIGQFNKYGYAQVVDSVASSICALPKYGSLAKFYFNKHTTRIPEEQIKVENHHLGEKTFCSGAAFVSKKGGHEEDDGWIISFVHNEDSNTSQIRIIDAKRFESEPVVNIALPQRVPYGFHGAFIPRPTQL